MDQGSYTFQALCSKYEDFRSPAFTVKVEGKEIKSSEIPLTVEVDLCADGSAGGCSFQIESMYDCEHAKWLNNLTKTLEVGSTLEVRGGYVKQEPIFYGYVDEVTVSYSGSGSPSLSVTGMDGLGFLMNCREPVYGGQQELKKVVQDLLNKPKSVGYAKKITIGSLFKFDTPTIKERIDDFKYLRMLAERQCVNLMCVNGELIFDNVLSNTKPLMTLTVGASLLSFQKRLTLQGQVNEVEIRGKDENGEQIKGVASSVSFKGTGKTAAQTASEFKKTTLLEENQFVRTNEECKRLAQAKLDTLALNYVSGSGACLGIPELIPGRFLTIEGLDGDTVGDYFITKVHHRFGPDGYLTQFEVKGAKN